MSAEYYMFLEEVRMISGHIDKIHDSTNENVLRSIFFMEDLKAHIECFDRLLLED
ncbi:MAG: hypothetical protein ACFE9C_15165 [Candidatus Hodarchaeota archaeon]